MGKKGNWFVAVKKAFSPESNEKRELSASKSKKRWSFGKQKRKDISSSTEEVLREPPLPYEEVKHEEVENGQREHAEPEPTAAVPEAAVAQVPANNVRPPSVRRYPGKSVEEAAAITIQTAFRGYLARRALRGLRGLVRLKTLIDGQSVKRQSTNTLRCMQTLARVQSQIRARRIRMAEENQALQRQLQLKREKELEHLRATMGDDWDDSHQSKEQLEAKLQSKQEAAMRRERALAYAYSHQQMSKNSSRSPNPTFMDPNNPHWGWSWLERWMAARPWESRSIAEKEINDQSSVKSGSRSVVGGEISKAYARRDFKVDKSSPTAHKPTRLSPSTPTSKLASSSPAGRKLKSASTRGNSWTPDDDARSMVSIQSERPRRHSIAGSSVRDDESLASSPSATLPSYMVATQSAKARSRLQTPSPMGNDRNNDTPDRGSSGLVKKRLSFPSSPGAQLARRHSGPPKIDNSSIMDISVNSEHNNVSNGGAS